MKTIAGYLLIAVVVLAALVYSYAVKQDKTSLSFESGLNPILFMSEGSYIGPHVSIYNNGKLILDTGEGFIGTYPDK